MHHNTSAMYNFSTIEDDRIIRLIESHMTPQSAGITALAVIILLLFIAYCLFIMFLLLHGAHRRQLQIQLAASCIFAHLPTAIFLHTGSIQLMVLKKAITLSYCWFTIHIRSFTQIIIPYTLMMFSIERLMYISNPTAYAQKINRASHMTLLAFPWAIATILSILDVNLHLRKVVVKDVYVGISKNLTFNACHTEMSYVSRWIADIVLRVLLGGMIPLLICLIIAVIMLVMWCCFKRKYNQGRDYSMMGDQVEVTVRNSVIAVSFLNFVYIVTSIIVVATRFRIRLTYVTLSFYGVVEGIVWIFTFVDVRKKFVAIFPCSPKRAVDGTSMVDYTVNNTNMT